MLNEYTIAVPSLKGEIMKTKNYYISALLVVTFIVPMWSVVYGRFEPKQPPITDPYNPQEYMRELARQLPPAEAEILLRGINIPSTTPTRREGRAATIIPKFRPTPEEDRARTVVPSPTLTPKEDRAATVPEVSKTYSRIHIPPSRKAKPKSRYSRIIYRRPDSKKILQVYCSNIPEDELRGTLERVGLCLVPLSDDPRIYAVPAPEGFCVPSYDTPVVVDSTGRRYLLFSSSDITLSELTQALEKHPSNFRIVEECDSSHPICSKPSALSVVSDKLGQLLSFLGSGFTRNPEKP